MASKIDKENMFYDMIFQEIEKNSIRKYSSIHSSEYSFYNEEAEELFLRYLSEFQDAEGNREKKNQ
jgi:hypothetical protein